MLPPPSGGSRRRRFVAFCFIAMLASLSGILRAVAQTPQPWLFVETIANGKPTGAVTFLRDDSSGALTQLANSQSTFTNPCGPSSLDPKGRFLYGYCADGLSMYTLDASTGAVTEVATSPYQVSGDRGKFGAIRVPAEVGPVCGSGHEHLEARYFSSGRDRAGAGAGKHPDAACAGRVGGRRRRGRSERPRHRDLDQPIPQPADAVSERAAISDQV
jgi:hypothetical protein